MWTEINMTVIPKKDRVIPRLPEDHGPRAAQLYTLIKCSKATVFAYILNYFLYSKEYM